MRDGRVVERGADAADDAAQPRDAKEDRGDDAAHHPGKPCREREREREDHEPLAEDEAQELHRVGRLITAHGLHRDELDHGGRQAVHDDDRREPEPFPEHVFGARDRPRQDRQGDPGLELTRDRWRRDEQGGERQDPAEHEHHEDEELRNDRLLLRVRERLPGVAEIVDARHPPYRQRDHHQREQHEREQKSPSCGFVHDLTRDDEDRPHLTGREGSGSVLRAIRVGARRRTRGLRTRRWR